MEDKSDKFPILAVHSKSVFLCHAACLYGLHVKYSVRQAGRKASKRLIVLTTSKARLVKVALYE